LALRSLPGTVSAGAIVNLPLGDGGTNGDFQIRGRTFPLHQEPIAEKSIVTSDYLHAMRIRLLRGRLFNDRDGRDAHTVAIINESLARRFWRDQNPIGQHLDISLSEKPNWQEIVGVVADVKRDALDASTTSEIYVPQPQMPSGAMTLVIRSTGDLSTLASAVRLRVAEADKELPIFNVQTMQQVVFEFALRTPHVNDSVGCICRMRHAARKYRDLRCGFLLGSAANARDRNSIGSRRESERHSTDDAGTRNAADRCRHSQVGQASGLAF
jgi:hypothetical protein